MDNLDAALAEATRVHQAGQLAEAEPIYRQILARSPNHPHALHQLGLLAMQARQFDPAIALIGRALTVLPMQGEFHANLGEAYRHAGRTVEAIESYRRALQINPSFAPVHTLLGMLLQETGQLDEAAAEFRHTLRLQPGDARANTRLGQVLDQQSRFTEAENCFREALRADDSAPAHFNLASSLQSQNRDEEAIAAYGAALARQPAYAEVHNNLATLLKRQGRLADAESHLHAAISAIPRFAAAHANLALVQESQGQLDRAADSYEVALDVDPNLVAAWQGLGTIRRKQGQFDEAVRCYEHAVRIDPTQAESHLGLGYLLQLQHRIKRAIECCHEAIRLDPQRPDAYSNLGLCWAAEGRHDEAIAALRQALQLDPGHAASHGNLAVSLRAVGLLDDAIHHHRQAVELAPEAADHHSNLLYTLNYHPGYDAQALFAEHQAWGRRHADPLTAASPPHGNDRTPDRRLRIGYVSPNFCAHAINFFVEPILAEHDHASFEVFCYSDGEFPDETTGRLRGYTDPWQDTTRLTDTELSQLIREDKIDVLVDLTGHINGGRRLLTFARRPAPVQITYIGYQNTTGMRAMDYRVTDDYADPPGVTDALYTERLMRLPSTFFVYLPTPDAPEVGALPASRNGHVTFASVNSFTKITPEVLQAWAEILRRVPDARLLLRADMTESLRVRLTDFFTSGGIEAERLELVNRLPRAQYLELIARADIALDPFPFNGHTTTCDCLWQGVPVVTLSGETYVSRFGGSGLNSLGLKELISRTPEEYVCAAVALAEDRPRLQHYRDTLRQQMAGSALLDYETFTRNLEEAFRGAWVDWCARQHTPVA